MIATSRPAPRTGDDSGNPGDLWADAMGAHGLEPLDDQATDPRARSVDPARRRAVAEHWARAAGQAHAAIARWTRFSLQLLAIGAPPGLLTAAHEAAQDAIDHARFASALAGAFSDAPLPAAPVEGAAGVTTDLGTIVRDLVDQACVRGTLAVVEAMTRAEKAHADVRAAFGQIAADEAEHAALAWASLAWVVDTQGAEAGRLAVDLIDRAVDASLTVTERVGVSVPDLGVLSSLDKADARQRALDEVVAPLRDEIARRAARGVAAA